MTITSTTLTRVAGRSAVAAGLLFIGVQINHPHLDAAFATTTEYTLRESAKILMAVLALVGITGMYLRQTKQTGLLGLLGYLLFSACYLLIMSIQVIGVCVLPALAHSAPGYVNDAFAVATGGHPAGDVGLLVALNSAVGACYLGGGLIFGIALFRAGILARWASATLGLATLATLAIPLLPMINQRLFAVPTGVALIGLGYSLWREQRTPTAVPVVAALDPAGAW